MEDAVASDPESEPRAPRPRRGVRRPRADEPSRTRRVLLLGEEQNFHRNPQIARSRLEAYTRPSALTGAVVIGIALLSWAVSIAPPCAGDTEVTRDIAWASARREPVASTWLVYTIESAGWV